MVGPILCGTPPCFCAEVRRPSQRSFGTLAKISASSKAQFRGRTNLWKSKKTTDLNRNLWATCRSKLRFQGLFLPQNQKTPVMGVLSLQDTPGPPLWTCRFSRDVVVFMALVTKLGSGRADAAPASIWRSWTQWH